MPQGCRGGVGLTGQASLFLLKAASEVEPSAFIRGRPETGRVPIPRGKGWEGGKGKGALPLGFLLLLF